MTDALERTYTWHEPTGPEAAAGRTGLETLRAIATGDLPARRRGQGGVPPPARRLPLQPDRFSARRRLCHALDSAAACAVHSTLPVDVVSTTLDLSVKFLRRITVETGEVRATGWVVHAGHTTALARAELTDADGRLFGEATSSCLILRD